jgi:hypothetical protein
MVVTLDGTGFPLEWPNAVVGDGMRPRSVYPLIHWKMVRRDSAREGEHPVVKTVSPERFSERLGHGAIPADPGLADRRAKLAGRRNPRRAMK